MRLIISILFLIAFTANSQGDSNNVWDKIIITDSHSGWNYYSNTYTITKNDNNEVLMYSQDSSILPIDSDKIELLFSEINRNRWNSDTPLEMFDRDSNWLISNSTKLWSNFKEDKKTYPKDVDTFAIKCIENYELISPQILRLTGTAWTDDYPSVVVEILNRNDTIRIGTYGQYPYMLPWYTSNGLVYNSKISVLVAELLPNERNSNKTRLEGKYFNSTLMDYIFNFHVEDYAQLAEFKSKYPRKTRKLEEHFKIKQANLMMMGSIEWGGIVASECAKIILTDSSLSRNIQFSTIFGRRAFFLHSTKPIIRKKEKLIEILESNPVYKYTLEKDSCKGEIHFVNTKSLSGQAKRAFKGDLKRNPDSSGKLNGTYRKAIFYELTDFKNGKRSFSRWIFLHDGTIILWQLKGAFLMNLPEKFWNEEGYVCKEIPRSEF